MIYLGLFTAGNSVFYAANFHWEGTAVNPTGLEAQLRDPAGVWSALATPSQQNSKTGHYGGTIDTTDFDAGQYAIRLAGTVSSGKVQAAEFTFTVDAVVASVTGAVGSVIADVGITQAGAKAVSEEMLVGQVPTVTYLANGKVSTVVFEYETKRLIWTHNYTSDGKISSIIPTIENI